MGQGPVEYTRTSVPQVNDVSKTVLIFTKLKFPGEEYFSLIIKNRSCALKGIWEQQ